LPKHGPQLLADQPGDNMGDEIKSRIGKDLVTLSQASRDLAEHCMADGDWAGLPMPVPGLKLVLEPRYKHKALSEFRWSECYDQDGTRLPFDEEPAPKPSGYTTVNSWWNDRYQLNIVVVKDKQGRARFTVRFEDRLAFTIRTLDAAAAWPLEAEQRAQKKLATLIRPDLFELYQLTGHFPELSERSQVTYLFRRGRPTIALRLTEDHSLPLCALCLHPIGYYGETWAGVMCPTDEVIAHLLMMRGSEEKFWANANQHPVDRPSAGV
jgi:hypothetical protein